MAASSVQRLSLILKAHGIRATKKQLAGLQSQVNGSSRAMMAFAGKAGVIAIATATLYAFVKTIGHSIEAGKKFEQAMANLKAISGATKTELLNLSVQSRDLGMKTKFTATQVANLQTEYARLGYTVKQIQAATRATLDLAAATGEDLSNAAIVAGQTVRAFRLQASDTTRVTDVMAKSFTSSALDMSKFTDSMTYVAPVARMAGFSIEDTSATLAVLANAGISGSIAGTSLRRIFLELSNESSKLTKRLGGPVKNSKELAAGLRKLSDEGLTTADVKRLVGLRATSAFNILMKGTDTLEELTEALENAGGAAYDMANIQLATLEGRVTIMKSAWEGFGISLYDFLEEPLSDATVAMTGFINIMNDWISIPTSAKLQEEQNNVNALVTRIYSHNESREEQIRLISKIKQEYPAYFGDLNEEESSLDEVSKSLSEYNKHQVKRIVLASRESDRTTIYNAEADAIEKVRSAQHKLAVLIRETLKMNSDIVIDETATIEEQVSSINNQMNKLMKAPGKGFFRDVWYLATSGIAGANAQLGKLTKATEVYNLAKEAQIALEKGNITELQRLNNEINTLMKELGLDIEDAAGEDDPEAVQKGWWRKLFGYDDPSELKDNIQMTLDGISEVFNEFASQRIQEAKDEANAQIDILNTQQSAELKILKDTWSYKRMSEKRQLEEEKKITDKYDQLRKDEKDAANKDMQDAFRLQQTAKLASIAMETADAVMKTVGYSPLTGGQPWAGIAIAIGAMQAMLVTQQKPPEMAQGGLIGGLPHSQGGTVIEAEKGEYIISKGAVDKYGASLFQKLNQGSFDKFQEGGLVTNNMSDEADSNSSGVSQNINITFEGNILSQDFIEEEAIPMIKNAIRRGADIGVD